MRPARRSRFHPPQGHAHDRLNATIASVTELALSALRAVDNHQRRLTRLIAPICPPTLRALVGLDFALRTPHSTALTKRRTRGAPPEVGSRRPTGAAHNYPEGESAAAPACVARPAKV